MRITGGDLRGRVLTVPKGMILRPTQDRIRQAAFNIIGPRIVGSRFLDLFAGTGAVGLEAWSRGAKSVVSVESGRQALAALEANVKALCPYGVTIWRGTLSLFAKAGSGGEPFDIAYADPPYGTRDGRFGVDPRLAIVRETLDAVYSARLMRPGGLLIWECRADMKPEVGSMWNQLQRKDYGSTSLLMLSPNYAEALP